MAARSKSTTPNPSAPAPNPATAAEIATLEPAARPQTVGHSAVVDEAIHAMRTAVEAGAD